MNITVVGTGYVGLVTGACFSYVGNNVCCLDIDKDKISLLKNGKLPIFEEGLQKIVDKSVLDNKLSFTHNYKDAIDRSDIIFLAVSTPMNEDGSSKLEYILNAADEIAENINDYKIIIVKSTVPVGTTEIIEKRIKDKIKLRKVDVRFDIANNPEFLKEGKAVNDFMHPDRIIVGLNNNKIQKLFRDLYRPFTLNNEKLFFLNIRSSELTKYAANAMLAMKVSFINELSQLCEKIDANINDVRQGIGSDKRIGYSFINPSLGFGGSCFPKDVNSLKKQFEDVGLSSLTSRATLEVNEIQSNNFANRILKYFDYKKITNVCLAAWGITFKPGTDDIRESPAIKVIDILLDNNITINLSDPQGLDNAREYFKERKNINFFNDKDKTLDKINGLLLLTEWEEYRTLNFNFIKSKIKNNVIFDGRNLYSSKDMRQNKIDYIQIGVRDDLVDK